MPLSRMYNTAADAAAAVSELKESGLEDKQIRLIIRGSDYIGVTALGEKGVMRDNAKAYVEAFKEGMALVVVSTMWGFSQIATEILNTARAGDTGGEKAQYEGLTWDEGAPLSSALNLPVLAKSGTLLSDLLGLPTLSKSSKSGLFGLPLLTKSGPSLPFPTLTKSGPSLPFPTLTKSGPSLPFPTLMKSGPILPFPTLIH